MVTAADFEEVGVSHYYGNGGICYAEKELRRMEEFQKAQAEVDKKMMQSLYRRKCLR
ncbi:MAG: hypothetical protein NC429_16175 [Lachnospiraceae bacterium]|nr:hypothetical protein [Lachnospiraceae bacterium]